MKSKIRIMFKNGKEFTVECDKLVVTHDKINNAVSKISYEGATTGIPMYINFDEILAVVQEG